MDEPARVRHHRVYRGDPDLLDMDALEGVEARIWPNSPSPEDLPNMLRCLRRIRSSIRFWNKESGRRGYLEFVSEYAR